LNNPESAPVIDMGTYASVQPHKAGVPRDKGLSRTVAVIRLLGGIVQGQNAPNKIADKDAISLLRWVRLEHVVCGLRSCRFSSFSLKK
jgi:ClpP class serine protease